MSMETHSADQIISQLTCDVELNLGRVIQDIFPATPSTIHPERSISSLGQLDTLPAELLHITLNLLDFQSLSRVSRVSLRGKRVVENFLPYQQVIQHAPKVPTALIKTNLVGYYPASEVYRILKSYRCVSCSDFGAFLYLPTCERVCFECLFQNRGLWMMTLPMAKKYFVLTQRQVQALHIMRIIPGTYCVRGPEKAHHKPCQLVSVKSAKRLAIKLHGSVQHLAQLIPQPPIISSKDYYLCKRYHEAPLEAPACDMSKLSEEANIGNDPFAGVSSLRVPYITDSRADWGQLCKGCQITYKDFKHGSLPSTVLTLLCPQRTRPERPVFALTTRLHSRHGLLIHAEHCYGARKLLRNMGD
ncbi:hypothetical protein FOYG_12741 [Fusarium oxysporum NRRL 32931]|uniref:F-box domain-containing protein n=1 Tax=Fusarium oxysporum NRRL 32931 TaxID=660029 RepID=W9HX67_FUSOX|nr:hypothetical protein FOYG_12741 [Fusarium oxysporum NRRL 32931]